MKHYNSQLRVRHHCKTLVQLWLLYPKFISISLWSHYKFHFCFLRFPCQDLDLILLHCRPLLLIPARLQSCNEFELYSWGTGSKPQERRLCECDFELSMWSYNLWAHAVLYLYIYNISEKHTASTFTSRFDYVNGGSMFFQYGNIHLQDFQVTQAKSHNPNFAVSRTWNVTQRFWFTLLVECRKIGNHKFFPNHFQFTEYYSTMRPFTSVKYETHDSFSITDWSPGLHSK